MATQLPRTREVYGPLRPSRRNEKPIPLARRSFLLARASRLSKGKSRPAASGVPPNGRKPQTENWHKPCVRRAAGFGRASPRTREIYGPLRPSRRKERKERFPSRGGPSFSFSVGQSSKGKPQPATYSIQPGGQKPQTGGCHKPCVRRAAEFGRASSLHPQGLQALWPLPGERKWKIDSPRAEVLPSRPRQPALQRKIAARHKRRPAKRPKTADRKLPAARRAAVFDRASPRTREVYSAAERHLAYSKRHSPCVREVYMPLRPLPLGKGPRQAFSRRKP